MPTVRYDGPGDVLDAFGKTVLRGKEAVFSDAETRSLRAQPHIHIAIDGRILPPLPELTGIDVTRPSAHGSRTQWAAYAANNGVEITDDMSREQIIAAVDKPEAEPGEGQFTTAVSAIADPVQPNPKEQSWQSPRK